MLPHLYFTPPLQENEAHGKQQYENDLKTEKQHSRDQKRTTTGESEQNSRTSNNKNTTGKRRWKTIKTFCHLTDLRNRSHENPGLWSFGDRSGVVRGSFRVVRWPFRCRSGVVRGSLRDRWGVDGGRSGSFQGHSGVVRDLFGGRSAVVRGSFENFSIFFFRKTSEKNQKSILSEIY